MRKARVPVRPTAATTLNWWSVRYCSQSMSPEAVSAKLGVPEPR
jgi:hypothetical protein